MSNSAAIEHSVIIQGVRGLRRRLVTAVQTNVISETMNRAASNAKIPSLVERAGRQALAGSWLYRWLTTEPEPRVIEIDLRETWTVGPVLRALEPVLQWLQPRVETAESVSQRLEGAVAHRAVQLLAAFTGIMLLAIVTSLLRADASLAVIGFVTMLAAIAFLFIRIQIPWSDLGESRSARVLQSVVRLLEPPDMDEEPQANDDAESATEETAE
jgi:hypothetical protein